MESIFSTQNLHTFLRRKYLRPPSRGPPGPRPGRGPDDVGAAATGGAGAGVSAGASAVAWGLCVSSAMLLLQKKFRASSFRFRCDCLELETGNLETALCRCRRR